MATPPPGPAEAIRQIVFHTDQPDAAAGDVERWAAERGYIIATPTRVPDGEDVEFGGRIMRPGPQESVWRAEIVISEGIR